MTRQRFPGGTIHRPVHAGSAIRRLFAHADGPMDRALRWRPARSLPALLILTLAGLAPATAMGTTPPSAGPADTGYWHTNGTRIVDASGRMVRIAAVNWFGMEGRHWVPEGLEKQPLDTLMARVRELGFNTIRLPFSNQVVEQNPVITDRVDANPALKGLHALDVLDRIVAAAGNQGLRIILDDQRSSAGIDPNESGLWYAKGYPESAWVADWKSLAARYKGNPTVVGVDLRNEPHTLPPGPWSLKTYLHQGATWGPYKGRDNPNLDWRLAAERGGNAVLAVNPRLLIFVEGIQQYPDPTQPGGVDPSWWGSILSPAATYPVVLAVPHRLVYSTHEYGPIKYPMPWLGLHMTYASLVREWNKHWAAAAAKLKAPLFLGEFGTCGSSPRCVSDTKPGSQGLWFSSLLRYLRAHPAIGWAFWALNANDTVNKPMVNYVLQSDWSTVRLPALIDAFHQLEKSP
jgi:endoglucanase